MSGLDLLLVGHGRMGAALAAGWRNAGLVRHLWSVDPHAVIRRQGLLPSLEYLPRDFTPQAVIFAVKPQNMAEILPFYRRFVTPQTLFLSIAAGRTLRFLQEYLGDDAHIVRSMPNTPASIGQGMSVCCAPGGLSSAHRRIASDLLGAVGQVAWVHDEAVMDAVTAVSGSGPAYFFYLIETLTEAGIKAGLSVDLARILARKTLVGAAHLAESSDDSAQDLRLAVTSPGGTTEAALRVLSAENGLPDLMAQAIQAATERSRELAGHIMVEAEA